MADPGFVASIMAHGSEEAKRLLRLLGCVEQGERPCEHDWHRSGTVDGRTVYDCQTCGATRRE